MSFYTTSTDKFLQARYVFGRAGLELGLFRSKRDPYSENEDAPSRELLRDALDEILGTVGRGSFFFVEDTSLEIHALSKHGVGFPGLRVKEWFAKTSFADLDRELRMAGNDRSASIKSDIALHVPGLREPVYFHGESHGDVADSPPTFATNPQHPWLTPDTFNGWFIPAGTRKRLGELSVEESLTHDFRAKALGKLLNRLEQYAYALNAPPTAYTARGRRSSQEHPRLFPPDRPQFVIVGPPCAGKTTFAEHASSQHGLRHIEASSVVRSLDQRSPDESPAEFAWRVLREKGSDIVARRILELYDSAMDEGFCVSGFRTIQEVLTLNQAIPTARVVFVDAVDRIRFERYLRRGRTDEAANLDEFRDLDRAQADFGLLPVAPQIADIRITNDAELDAYREIVDAVVTQRASVALPGLSGQPRSSDLTARSQLRRCLAILEAAGRPLSTDEIEQDSAADGTRIRHNNANKVLKRFPGLVSRLPGGSSRVRYDLRDAGRAYLRLLEAQSARDGASGQPSP